MSSYWKRKKLTQAQYDGIKNELPFDELINIDDTSIALGNVQFSGGGGSSDATYLTATDETATLPNSIDLGSIGVNGIANVLVSTPFEGTATVSAVPKVNGSWLIANSSGVVEFNRTLNSGNSDLTLISGVGTTSISADNIGLATSDLTVTYSMGANGVVVQTSNPTQAITLTTTDVSSDINLFSGNAITSNCVSSSTTCTGNHGVTAVQSQLRNADSTVTSTISNTGLLVQTTGAAQDISFLTGAGSSNIGLLSAGNIGISGGDISISAAGILALDAPSVTIPNIATGTGTDLVRDGTNQILLKTSSRRYKENITDLTFDSSKILDLNAKSFNYKTQPGLETFGWIAEEVDEVLPNLVTRNSENEIESVRYSEAIVLLVEEVKKLREKVIALEAKNV